MITEAVWFPGLLFPAVLSVNDQPLLILPLHIQ